MRYEDLMLKETFSRKDTSIIGRWWWTVDRWSLAAITIIVVMGIMLSFAASPAVADRLNLGGFYFVKRHIFMVIPALLIMFFVSLLALRNLRRMAALMYIAAIVLLILTLLNGAEVKGARRWINMGSFSLQASEFMKPAFAIMAAWMLSEKLKVARFPGLSISFIFLLIPVALLLMQPDLGMTIVMISTWIGQLFIAGIPLFWIGFSGAIGVIGMLGAYCFLPHVARRVDQFLDPSSGDPKHDLYQVHQSLEAFKNGGLLGKGPGEGVIKKHIPDVHADFVFAVAGEEFGIFLCLFLVGLFAFVVVRTFLRVINEQSLFVILATSGIILQFGMQAVINMASTLHIIPTKGMTMPFISYGGSSMVALGIGMGMVLALTRKRHGAGELI